jgi:hypothetical protein
MGCLAVLAALVAPRVVMFVLWLFTDYLGRAYEGFVLPLIGFFALPTTTLAYAVAHNEFGGFSGWGAALVIVAVLLDVGLWGRGRGLFAR